MPGIFSQKFQASEHKTPPGSAVRSIAGIAYEIGFDDPGVFRARAGEPPAAWRRKQLEQG